MEQLELAADGYDGGGIEVFYGKGTGNRIPLGQGDALVFPSLIMHRAPPVQRGTRWTLVSWLTGREPCNEPPLRLPMIISSQMCREGFGK